MLNVVLNQGEFEWGKKWRNSADLNKMRFPFVKGRLILKLNQNLTLQQQGAFQYSEGEKSAVRSLFMNYSITSIC